MKRRVHLTVSPTKLIEKKLCQDSQMIAHEVHVPSEVFSVEVLANMLEESILDGLTRFNVFFGRRHQREIARSWTPKFPEQNQGVHKITTGGREFISCLAKDFGNVLFETLAVTANQVDSGFGGVCTHEKGGEIL